MEHQINLPPTNIRELQMHFSAFGVSYIWDADLSQRTMVIIRDINGHFVRSMLIKSEEW